MFPGQGAQELGMGKEIYEAYPEARKIYEIANSLLGIKVEKLCFESTQEELQQTKQAQISILVTSLAILEVIKKAGIQADICTGLSLGEYTALIYAGYLSLEEGIKLIQKRGYYMQEYVPKEEFKMVAIMGLESSKIEEICKQVEGFVVPANYNYSGQTVISGKKEEVQIAVDKLKEAGAKKTVELKTSGPFHTKKLQQANELFQKELEKVNFLPGTIEVARNLDGKVYQKQDDPKEILKIHMVSPVRFDKTIQTMQEKGIDTYFEIGPGKTLSSFVKKEQKEANVIAIQDQESLKKAIEMVRK